MQNTKNIITYNYYGRYKDGKIARGRVEALDLLSANRKLASQGILPIKINKQFLRAPNYRLSVDDKIASRICIDISRLLSAGLPLNLAIRALINSYNKGNARKILSEVILEIEGGNSFAKSMGKYKGNTANSLAGIIKIGEQTGKLSEVMQDAGRSFKTMSDFRGKILSTLMYPLIIIILAIIAVCIFILVVIPNLRPLFEGSGMGVPKNLAIVFGASDFIIQYFPLALLLVAVFCAVFIASNAFRIKTKKLFELLSLSKMGFGLANYIVYAAFVRRLSMATNVGVVVPEGFALASNASSFLLIKDSSIEFIKRLDEGVSLSKVISMMPGCPPLLLSLISAGEASGDINMVMKEAADLLEEESKARAEIITSILGPAITIIVGAIVGSIVILIFSGLTSIADGIGQ